MKDAWWDELTLDGYLKQQLIVTDARGAQASTFVRTLPGTNELPETTVGLGVAITPRYFQIAVMKEVPPPLEWQAAETLVDVIQEEKRNLSDRPNWQDCLLLDLGYASNTITKAISSKGDIWDKPETFNHFYFIPEEERRFLLEKHGFHKLAMMVAYGHTWNIDGLLRDIDEFRGATNYGDILELMAMGTPVEDIPLAIQLPPEMVKEIYGQR